MRYKAQAQVLGDDLPVRQVIPSIKVEGEFEEVFLAPEYIDITNAPDALTDYNKSKRILHLEYELFEDKYYRFGVEDERYFTVIQNELVEVAKGTWEPLIPRGVKKALKAKDEYILSLEKEIRALRSGQKISAEQLAEAEKMLKGDK